MLPRLFIACWPDPDVVRELAQALARTPELERLERTQLAADWHLTLAYIGDRAADSVESLHRCIDAVPWPEPVLDLQIFGVFAPPRVLWLGCERCPESLTGAQLALQQCLIERVNFRADTRTFYPHVTLARNFRAELTPARLARPVRWRMGPPCVAHARVDGQGERAPGSPRYVRVVR